ncbi:MAG: HAD family hydrolase [Peptococcaceae bacterium BICA1-8]|nr:MAG: HAD family hydrolase [Peptococcaceae bacterium BICA1-8]
MIKYIIFDFDGTLVDSKNTAITAFNHLSEKYKFKKIELKDFEHLRKLSITERCKALNFPIYKIPFLAAEAYQLYKKYFKDIELHKGIRELLDGLKNKGKNLAIISSNSETNIREYLQENKINSIDKVYCSSNIFGKDKMINNFLKKYKLRESEVIYIGDEERDIVASKKSGVKFIWVSWGFDVFEVVKQECPDYIVNKPEDIFGILDEIKVSL